MQQQPWIDSFGKSFWDLPKLIMFWEIWGLRKLIYKKLIFPQSQTKTSTKTHIAKRSNKYPNHHLLVHNLHMTKQKKEKKGEIVFVGWKERPKNLVPKNIGLALSSWKRHSTKNLKYNEIGKHVEIKIECSNKFVRQKLTKIEICLPTLMQLLVGAYIKYSFLWASWPPSFFQS